MTEWYYSKMDLQQGPVPETELLAKIRRGEIGGANLVWKDGMADWQPLSQIPELMPHTPGVSPGEIHPTVAESGNPPAIPGAGGNVPLPQPPAFRGHYAAQDIPSYLVPSIIALVLSCVSIFIVCLPIGLPFAIVAVVFATRVDSLRSQGNTLAAQSASKTARTWMVIAYVMAILPLLTVLGFMFVAAFGAMP